MLSVIYLICMLNLCQDHYVEADLVVGNLKDLGQNVTVFKPFLQFLPRGFRIAHKIPDWADAGYLAISADVIKHTYSPNVDELIRIRANMTYTGFHGILVYENLTVNLNEGDTIHYWIVRNFVNGTAQTIANKTDTIEIRFTDKSELEGDSSLFEHSDVQEMVDKDNEYLNYRAKNYNLEEFDLHDKIPHKHVPSKVYEVTYSDEDSSYFEKLLTATPELS